MSSRVRRVPGAAAVVAAALLVASCSGGPAGHHAPGGAGPAGSRSPAAAASWQATSTQDYALATWNYRDTLVVAANTQVTAYNRITGQRLWQTKAPVVQSHVTMFCGASQAVSGTTAVLGIGVATDSTGSDSDCHSIVSLDVTSGKLGWVRALPSNAEQVTYAESLEGQPGLAHKGLLVAVSGQTVVAGWMGVLAGFSLATGARAWTRVLGGEPNFENYVVKDIVISGADTYVVAGEVFPALMKLYRLTTAAGRIRRQLTMSRHVTGLGSPLVAQILSAAPLTVALEEIAPAELTAVVLVRRDLAASRIVSGGPGRASAMARTLFATAPPGNPDTRQFFPLALGGGLLIAINQPSGPDGDNQVIAFDVATGVRKWATTVPGTEILFPLMVTGPAAEVAGATAEGAGNPVLISLDAATGKVSSVSAPRVLGPAPLQQANNFYRFVTAGGHVYGVYWSLAKTAPGSVPAVFNLN